MKIRSVNIACKTLDPARFPRSPWSEIAVSGRSNVGKSSLLNTLLGRRDIARTSKEPGKTRSINFFAVNDRFYLVDLPGYGFARVSVELRERWFGVMSRYIGERENLAGIVQLIDARHPPSRDDAAMIDLIARSGLPLCVVFTKADKISRNDRRRALNDFAVACGADAAGAPLVFFSTETGEGKEELWRWIEERLERRADPRGNP